MRGRVLVDRHPVAEKFEDDEAGPDDRQLRAATLRRDPRLLGSGNSAVTMASAPTYFGAPASREMHRIRSPGALTNAPKPRAFLSRCAVVVRESGRPLAPSPSVMGDDRHGTPQALRRNGMTLLDDWGAAGCGADAARAPARPTALSAARGDSRRAAARGTTQSWSCSWPPCNRREILGSCRCVLATVAAPGRLRISGSQLRVPLGPR
jgi:hypothetical protein